MSQNFSNFFTKNEGLVEKHSNTKGLAIVKIIQFRVQFCPNSSKSGLIHRFVLFINRLWITNNPIVKIIKRMNKKPTITHPKNPSQTKQDMV